MPYLKEKKYKRKLIPTEAVFIRSPGAIVGMVAKISGNINTNDFEHAVKRLTQLHPILNCKIYWDENNQAHFEETNNPISISILTRNSSHDFEEIITKEWKQGFDLLNGPLCRFTLLRSDIRSEIIFVGHHTIVDGMSVTLIIDLLLKIMNKPNIELKQNHLGELPTIENLKKSVPKSSFIQKVMNKSITNFANNKWKKNKIDLPKEDITKAHRMYFEKIDYLVLIDEFSKEETSLFIDKCKKHNVTVNSALTIAFLACRKEIDPENISKKMIIPVDLRKHLNDSAKKSIGCYSTSLDIEFTYEPSKTFWGNVESLNALTNKLINNFQDIKKVENTSGLSLDFLEASMLSQRIQAHEEIFKSFPYAEKLGKNSKNIAAITAKNILSAPSSFTITNLGMVKIPCEYETIKLENLIMYPSSVSHPKANITLSVITIDDKLTLSYHVLKDNSDSNHTIESLKEKIRELILNI